MLRAHFKETDHMVFDGGKAAQGLEMMGFSDRWCGSITSHVDKLFKLVSLPLSIKQRKTLPYNYISDMVISLN